MIQDIQYEVEKRSKNHKKIPIINVKNIWEIMKDAANQEKSTFLFMKHFTLVKPKDILIKFTSTIGTFLFYMLISEKINIH